MIVRTTLLVTTVIGTLSFAGAAMAADAPVRKAAPAPAATVVERVQDCSAFYDPYLSRGFGWGSGPGLGVGMGAFEGALPRYPSDSFPNWYGECLTWGHYSATGSAR
jgi:hypothetical protein